MSEGLTVAVTGPTGDIGRAFLRALDKHPAVDRILGMARRPFDPAAEGYKKAEYRQGDILDITSCDELVAEADVVAHLAFVIVGSDKQETRRINLEGSRNVFTSAFNKGVRRLVYTSSVAAYGFHDDHPELIAEDVEPRGSDAHYYSAQKASVEELLANLGTALGRETDVYIFRPCIVAGPTALSLIENIPYVRIGQRLPGAAKKLLGALPLLRPVIPDPGTPVQIVHEDDVAAALVAGVLGRGEPGPYNLAAFGEITLTDIAHALGWYALPVADIVIEATTRVVSKLPYLPAEAAWVNAIKSPVLVDTTRARTKLDWKPTHDALETLSELVAAARARGLLTLKEREFAASGAE
ncbi:MAG: NAD-dependent epimerase/dehydratase family protein [Actinomycetota bacterium]